MAQALGPWVSMTASDTLASVIAGIGAGEATLLIALPIDILPPNHPGPANVVVPPNITLQFVRRGALHIRDDQTLIIQGEVQAGLQQIFAGPGAWRVSFAQSPTDEIRPEWFYDGSGDWTNAINWALAALGDPMAPLELLGDQLGHGGTVKLARRTYRLAGTIFFNGSYRQLVGNGRRATTLAFEHPAGLSSPGTPTTITAIARPQGHPRATAMSFAPR